MDQCISARWPNVLLSHTSEKKQSEASLLFPYFRKQKSWRENGREKSSQAESADQIPYLYYVYRSKGKWLLVKQ